VTGGGISGLAMLYALWWAFGATHVVFGTVCLVEVEMFLLWLICIYFADGWSAVWC